MSGPLLSALADPVVQIPLHAGLAALLGAAAHHKWRAPESFRAALAAYRLLPGAAERAAVRALPAAEMLVAVGLLAPGLGPLPGWAAAAPGWAAAGLMLLYGGAMAWNLGRGRELDCGCGLGGAPQPVRWSLVARNLALALAAGATALPALTRPLDWLDAFDAAAALAVGCLLFAGFGQAAQNAGHAGRTGVDPRGPGRSAPSLAAPEPGS